MADEESRSRPDRRSGPDLVTLVTGLVAMATAFWALFDAGSLLPPQWMLAVGSIVIGVVMLTASMRTRRGS